MIDTIYHILEKIGFAHPLHPAITHIPMGMVMGALLFSAAAMWLGKTELWRTSHHCITLALIFVVPTMILGYMDWQHRFQAEWSGVIIAKMVFAVFFCAALIASYVLGKKDAAEPKKMLIAYAVCVGIAIGLGFLGGELQYG